MHHYYYNEYILLAWECLNAASASRMKTSVIYFRMRQLLFFILLGQAWGAQCNDTALLKLYACCMVVWLLAVTSWFYDPHLHWAQICVLKICTCSTKTQLSKHAYQYFNRVSSLADHWRCHHNYWINSKQEKTKAPTGVRLYMLCLPHLQAR